MLQLTINKLRSNTMLEAVPYILYSQPASQIRALGLIATACLALFIFSCECETPAAAVVATNIVIDQGPDPLLIVTNDRGPLSATVLPANHTDGDVLWSSSSNEIVSVTSTDATTATYTGVAVGTATITATVGKTGEVSTNIVINVTSTAISASSITIEQGTRLATNLGSIGRLTATVLPTNHTEGAPTWFSSNTEIVTVVSNSGMYEAVAIGITTVTATVGEVSANIVIEVVSNIVPATNLTIGQGDSLMADHREMGILSATVLPTNHTDGQVEWSSSHNDIVSVTSSNANTATFFAGAVGSVTLTARVGGAEGLAADITISVSNNAIIDPDGDGLIDIDSLVMLHHIRHNLAGTSYKASSGDQGNSNGCPSEGCEGYELVTNLSFDTDGDGTWSGSNGNYTLDNDDDNEIYFDVSAGGWDPIGDDSDPFTAIFEGNGFTITGLATRRDLEYVGMFGQISGNAHIRGLGLVGNLADYTGSSGGDRFIGGLVALQISGHIFNSYTTGMPAEEVGIMILLEGWLEDKMEVT